MKSLLKLFLIFIISSAKSQVSAGWINTFNNPISNYLGTSVGERITLDKSKNVIVAGVHQYSRGGPFMFRDSSFLFVIKYTNNGSQVWVTHYNSPFDSLEAVNDLIIDEDNNIFVAGNTLNNNGESQALFLKIDSNGVFKWVDIKPTVSYDDDAKQIRIDDNNHPILCSSIRLANNSQKNVITKYSQSGQIIKQRMIDSASTDTYKYVDFEQDSKGNLYLGSTLQSLFNVIKLDSSLNVISTINLNSLNTIELSAIDVDTLQNIYLTGLGTNPVNFSGDYYTVKCKSNGAISWYKYYDGPANSSDMPKDIRVNTKGEVFVTGNDIGIGTNEDICTIKYDSLGNLQWLNRFDTTGNDDFGHKIIFDNQENVYVKGRMHIINESYATIKYTNSGSRLWSQFYNPYYENDWAKDICIDDSLSIFLTGYTSGYLSGDALRSTTIKYRQPQSETSILNITPNNFVFGFPNPTSDYFTINNFPSQSKYDVTITNTLGQELVKDLSFSDSKITLKLQHLPAQVLYISIISDKFTKTFKVIKQ